VGRYFIFYFSISRQRSIFNCSLHQVQLLTVTRRFRVELPVKDNVFSRLAQCLHHAVITHICLLPMVTKDIIKDEENLIDFFHY
jgi:hypothetical protein